MAEQATDRDLFHLFIRSATIDSVQIVQARLSLPLKHKSFAEKHQIGSQIRLLVLVVYHVSTFECFEVDEL